MFFACVFEMSRDIVLVIKFGCLLTEKWPKVIPRATQWDATGHPFVSFSTLGAELVINPTLDVKVSYKGTQMDSKMEQK